MRSVRTMAMMHEEMHQRTKEQEEIRQHTEQMRRVLRQKIEGRDQQEPAEHQATAGAPPCGFLRMRAVSGQGSHPPQMIGHQLIGELLLLG